MEDHGYSVRYFQNFVSSSKRSKRPSEEYKCSSRIQNKTVFFQTIQVHISEIILPFEVDQEQKMAVIDNPVIERDGMIFAEKMAEGFPEGMKFKEFRTSSYQDLKDRFPSISSIGFHYEMPSPRINIRLKEFSEQIAKEIIKSKYGGYCRVSKNPLIVGQIVPLHYPGGTAAGTAETNASSNVLRSESHDDVAGHSQDVAELAGPSSPSSPEHSASPQDLNPLIKFCCFGRNEEEDVSDVPTPTQTTTSTAHIKTTNDNSETCTSETAPETKDVMSPGDRLALVHEEKIEKREAGIGIRGETKDGLECITTTAHFELDQKAIITAQLLETPADAERLPRLYQEIGYLYSEDRIKDWYPEDLSGAVDMSLVILHDKSIGSELNGHKNPTPIYFMDEEDFFLCREDLISDIGMFTSRGFIKTKKVIGYTESYEPTIRYVIAVHMDEAVEGDSGKPLLMKYDGKWYALGTLIGKQGEGWKHGIDPHARYFGRIWESLKRLNLQFTQNFVTFQ